MATLKDVAEKVGVSITTVSRVMNGRGAISRETRDKVFAAKGKLEFLDSGWMDEVVKDVLHDKIGEKEKPAQPGRRRQNRRHRRQKRSRS